MKSDSKMYNLYQALLWLVVACLCACQGQAQTRTRTRTRGNKIIIPLPKDASGTDVYPDCNKGKKNQSLLNSERRDYHSKNLSILKISSYSDLNLFGDIKILRIYDATQVINPPKF